MNGTLRLKNAMEFCRWTGSPTTFKKLLPLGSFQKDPNNAYNLFRAIDVRKMRLMLMDVVDEPQRPNELPPIIYGRMSKGGVGKTTIIGNLAAVLAFQGYRVLMIDADPQASLTSLFGIDWAREEIINLGQLLQENEAGRLLGENLKKAIRPIYEDGMLDLIASDISMTSIDLWLSSVVAREGVAQRLFTKHLNIFSRYDAILIDGAPGTTQLSNALTCAAKNLLAVIGLDGQSIKAMDVFASNVSDLEKAFPNIEFNIRIVANGYMPTIATCSEALDVLCELYGQYLDPNVIPRAAGFMRQVSLQSDTLSGPVIEKEPNSVAAKSIVDLSQSLVTSYGIKLGGLLPMVLPRKNGPKPKKPTN